MDSPWWFRRLGAQLDAFIQRLCGRREEKKVKVANVNVGGRFGNVFEFFSNDEEWQRSYQHMIGVVDQPVPAEAELNLAPGLTWREAYSSLDMSIDIDFGSRPSALRGSSEMWYESTPAAYRDKYERLANYPADSTASNRLGIRALDMMCDMALAKAFADLKDFARFEARFQYVVREETAWRKKLEVVLWPLLDAGCDVIAVEESIWAGSSDGGRQCLDIAEARTGQTFVAVCKRDAELVVLVKRLEGQSKYVELEDGSNGYVVDDGTTFTLEPELARNPPNKSVSTTRRKTVAVDLGSLVVFCVHAKEHRNCAPLLAQYFDQLCTLVKPKPSIILSDTNVEKQDDVEAFSKEIKDTGLIDPEPILLTTSKERTVFQAQTRKARIPTVGATSSQDESRLVVAPKDRIIYSKHKLHLLDRTLYPETLFDEGEDNFRLPTPNWPSDHLAIMATFAVLS